jgi:glycolate oxidase FAD binding subunit
LAKTPRTWTGARTPSGLKRVRQAASRREVLQPRRSAAKTYVAKALVAAAAPLDAGLDANAALLEALSALDRAAKAGAIHPNAAARRKSRLTRKVNAALGGEHVQSGGRVVKNVAGYDMCKLFTGSLGTLGIITEMTLRVAPIAESSATVVVTGSLAQATQLANQLAASKLLPTAVFLSNDFTEQTWQLAVGFEGFTATVARQLQDIVSMAQPMGMNTNTLGVEKHQRVWQEMRDFPLQANQIVYRVTVPRASVMEIVNVVNSWHNDALNPVLIVDLAIGTVWFALHPSIESAADFPRLIALAQKQHGHAVMFVAPNEHKSAIDVWGPAPPSLALMREIKQQFDPTGILNPGRFIGGL